MKSELEHPVVLGAGPVGRAVAASLVARGCRPTVVTRSGTDVPGANSVAVDLSDPEQSRKAIAGATAVFHSVQPAYNRWPEEFPALQESILAACEATGAVLVAAENLYGHGPVSGPMTEETPLRPNTRKGRVRTEMWTALLEANNSGRAQTAAVRSSDFFGPGVVDSSFGGRFFPAIVSGKKASLLGDPAALHSITYVPDFGEAMVRVGEDPTSWGKAWIAPTAPPRRQHEIVAAAAEAAGVKPAYAAMASWKLKLGGLFIPAAKETIEMLYEFEEDFVVDSSAFQQHFGMAPTPLDEALAQTVAWFKQNP